MTIGLTEPQEKCADLAGKTWVGEYGEVKVIISEGTGDRHNISFQNVRLDSLVFIDNLLHKELLQQQTTAQKNRHYLFLMVQNIMLASRNAIQNYYGATVDFFRYNPE